ncbi:DUF5011 domain-containing protein [Chitinispirillales bacterium ANBcel5]|uniref:DUF5011 domain-containing protein n=1 Tax=Cellulosispirillum alkaliphilum TaxID=3039283 RepID=UPI002A535FD3|nr:DUF5011 domain-containing protein [Chitinispirillales bacterium ANBcel5]
MLCFKNKTVWGLFSRKTCKTFCLLAAVSLFFYNCDSSVSPDDPGEDEQIIDNGDGGDNGDTGDNGDSGDTGDNGDNGNNGDNGDNGNNGDTGDNGDSGDQAPSDGLRIEMVGESTITVEQYSDFRDPGATAYNDRGFDIGHLVETDDQVNTSVPGEYKVIYTVSSGGETVVAERTVIVVEQEPEEETLLDQFSVPVPDPLPSIDNMYQEFEVVGTGGPDLSVLTAFTVEYNAQTNTLEEFSYNSEGTQFFYNDIRSQVTYDFGSPEPSFTLINSGIVHFSGDYYIKKDGDALIFVRQDAQYAIIMR